MHMSVPGSVHSAVVCNGVGRNLRAGLAVDLTARFSGAGGCACLPEGLRPAQPLPCASALAPLASPCPVPSPKSRLPPSPEVLCCTATARLCHWDLRGTPRLGQRKELVCGPCFPSLPPPCFPSTQHLRLFPSLLFTPWPLHCPHFLAFFF